MSPRGVPQIEVVFDIDANGILSVGAADKASGKEQSIRIEGTGGLSTDEIGRMVSEAEDHASEDSERRESIEKHNSLDTMIYQAEKTLKENGEKLEADDRQSVEDVLTSAREDLATDEPAKLDAALQRLEAEMHRVAERLYKAEDAAPAQDSGADPMGGGEQKAGPADEDVIDAEYTEEKKDS
jgi:molecular chaperone DnaK